MEFAWGAFLPWAAQSDAVPSSPTPTKPKLSASPSRDSLATTMSEYGLSLNDLTGVLGEAAKAKASQTPAATSMFSDEEWSPSQVVARPRTKREPSGKIFWVPMANRASATFRGQHPNAQNPFMNDAGPTSWTNKVEIQRTVWEDGFAKPGTQIYPPQPPPRPASPPFISPPNPQAAAADARRHQQLQARQMDAKAAELEMRSREATRRAEEWRALARDVEEQAARDEDTRRAAEALQASAAFKYEKRYGVKADSLSRVARTSVVALR